MNRKGEPYRRERDVQLRWCHLKEQCGGRCDQPNFRDLTVLLWRRPDLHLAFFTCNHIAKDKLFHHLL